MRRLAPPWPYLLLSIRLECNFRHVLVTVIGLYPEGKRFLQITETSRHGLILVRHHSKLDRKYRNLSHRHTALLF